MADRIERTWFDRGDRSYDPYDGLLGWFPPAPLRRHRLWRLGTVQLHKRSPVNLRRLFGIEPTRNSYGTGLFASAAIALERLGPDSGRRARIGRRLEWLRAMRAGDGWAYPFYVETKTGSYPPTEPNVICTVFAGEAFLDANQYLGDAGALEVARDAATFVVRDLLVGAGGRSHFAYLRGYPPLIHNANVLGARFVVRCGRLIDDDEMVAAGFDAVAATVDAIGDDGSLAYGEGASLQWVDGHHTGFVVDALWHLSRLGRPDLAEPARAMAGYYAARLFEGGWPKQSPDALYPVDTIAGAQGIQTLARLGGEHLEHARAIAAFMLAKMTTKKGTFVYMRKKTHSKKIPYARWCDAPMAYALAVLASELDE